jgi:hypothetical protein
LVEQHVQSALTVADRALVLSRGRITMSGEAHNLMGRIDEIGASYLAEDPEETSRCDLPSRAGLLYTDAVGIHAVMVDGELIVEGQVHRLSPRPRPTIRD